MRVPYPESRSDRALSPRLRASPRGALCRWHQKLDRRDRITSQRWLGRFGDWSFPWREPDPMGIRRARGRRLEGHRLRRLDSALGDRAACRRRLAGGFHVCLCVGGLAGCPTRTCTGMSCSRRNPVLSGRPPCPLFNLSRTWPRMHHGPLKFLSAERAGQGASISELGPYKAVGPCWTSLRAALCSCLPRFKRNPALFLILG